MAERKPEKDTLAAELEAIAVKHGLVVFMERGGHSYQLMPRLDAYALMLDQWEPRARVH